MIGTGFLVDSSSSSSSLGFTSPAVTTPKDHHGTANSTSSTPTTAATQLAPNPYRYTREFILSLFSPDLKPPSDFNEETVGAVVVKEALEPLANLPLTELEKKV
jgi:hypothetical protein